MKYEPIGERDAEECSFFTKGEPQEHSWDVLVQAEDYWEAHPELPMGTAIIRYLKNQGLLHG